MKKTINLRRAKTSEKLNFLADILETKHKEIFNRWSIYSCAIALGLRINGLGTITKEWSCNSREFAKRYGITFDEANGLNYAEYYLLKVGMKSQPNATTPERDNATTIKAIRKLAKKYEEKRINGKNLDNNFSHRPTARRARLAISIRRQGR